MALVDLLGPEKPCDIPAAFHGRVREVDMKLEAVRVLSRKRIQGLKEGLNVGLDFAAAVGALAVQSNPKPLATTFNLNHLGRHNFPIGDDGSLSRADIYEGDNLNFRQDKFDEILAFYEGSETATIPAASLARYERIKRQRALNPDKFIYGARQLVLSYGETALYLSTMGNPSTGDAPVSFVRSLFEEERLPYEQGWSKPPQETTLTTLGLRITQLQLANPEALPEGLSLGEGTFRNVIELRDPITGKLENITCGLLGFF